MRCKQKRQRFRRSLFRWYEQHGRDLPWRQTTDPYAVLVSEIMLQQTQVASVIPYYTRWLSQFPTFSALADSSESDVLRAWQGLGYYSRARNLHSAAKIVVSRYNGILPRVPEKIGSLPGLGRYTTNAVATFAFNQSVPIVEANITRVVARLFNISLPVESTAGRKQLWDAAESLLPKRNAARFNSALMDLGALICSKTPRCNRCPVKSFCRARKPETLPIKKARPKTMHLTECHAFVRRGQKLLLQKCFGRWRGMWMLPTLPITSKRKQPVYSAVFPFTHHRVDLRVFESHARREQHHQGWMLIHHLDQIPIPSPHRRALTSLLRDRGLP